MELTERKKKVLQTVVDLYIRTAEPVGSKAIAAMPGMNTNVCPSLHVIGSLAVLAAAWNTPRFATPLWRTAFTLQAVLISISTVFLKQHSLLDIPPAVALSAIAYYLVYIRRPRRSKPAS